MDSLKQYFRVHAFWHEKVTFCRVTQKQRTRSQTGTSELYETFDLTGIPFLVLENDQFEDGWILHEFSC